MKILIACELSGTIRDAFNLEGHDAISCDLKPSDTPGRHYTGDIRDIMFSENWDLVIAHPPCTYMANSGSRWLYNSDGSKNEERWSNLNDACQFFNYFLRLPFPIVTENPIMHKHARVKIDFSYNQIIHPWQYGHTTKKATCLWIRGVPFLKPTQVIEKEKRTDEIHFCPPGPERQKIRSKTFSGIAKAMVDQWGIKNNTKRKIFT